MHWTKGKALKSWSYVLSLEPFFGNDIYGALFVIGGVAMSFHFTLLHNLIGGVPPVIAIGDLVPGKSTAVEAAMAIFEQREPIRRYVW